MKTFKNRLRSLWRRRVKQEIDEELRFHIEQRTAENIAAGMAPEDAAREARKKFGNLQSVREECRDTKGAGFAEGMWRDLRFAGRQFAKSPGFTAIAVLTLAIGIGGSTVMFGFLKKLVLEPLPYPEGNRIVQLWATDIADTKGVGKMPFSTPDYFDLREQNHSFAEIGCYVGDDFTLDGDIAEQVSGVGCTASLARVLGVQPLLGRWFTEEEEKPGADHVVVLSHGLWQQRFAADPAIIGQTIQLNREEFTVLGVLPAGADLYSSWASASGFALFRPLVLDRENSRRNSHAWATLARLKPGVPEAAAAAELRAFGLRLAKAFPESNARVAFRLIPLSRQVFGDAANSALIQQIAVLLVLLLACANVAGMLAARAARRQTELAMRTALGATRGHIFRLLLAESFTLSILASILGVFLAVWGLDLLGRIAPDEALARGPARIDGPALLFAASLAFVSAFLAGWPSMRVAVKAGVLSALKDGGMQQTGSNARLRHVPWLIVGQIALTLLLVNVAILLSVSYRKVIADSNTFVTDHVLTADINLVGNTYQTAEARLDFRRRLLDRLRAQPGVKAAGITSKLPFRGGQNGSILVENDVYDPNASRLDVEVSWVTPDYFAAAGIKILRGRLFDDADGRATPEGVLINRALADYYWPGCDPLGKMIRWNMAKLTPLGQVVGVVEDVRQWGAECLPQPEVYFSATQAASTLKLVLRTDRDAHAWIPELRRQLKQIDPTLALAHPCTLRDIFSEATQLRHFQMLLLDGFMAAALLLAAVGLYGTLAFQVAARTREIGVRIALGGSASAIIGLVLRPAARWLLIGAGAGLVLTLGAGAILRSIFYQTSPLNPACLTVSTILVTAAAGFACWFPARRAARVNPIEALRCE